MNLEAESIAVADLLIKLILLDELVLVLLFVGENAALNLNKSRVMWQRREFAK